MRGWYAALGCSLALTLLLELAFALALGRRGRDLGLVALVNVLTNPLVVLAFLCWTAYTPWSKWLLLPFLEGFAVLTEGRLYRSRGLDFRRPYLFSLCANAFSYGMGLAIQTII